MHFAKDNGIEIDQLNTHTKVSGSGGVRRSKKRALKSRVSIQIPNKLLKKVEQGIIKTGIDIHCSSKII
jgi:hypothetical protein